MSAPVLIVIDDLQRCDESSLLTFRALANHVKETPFLLIGAYREEEVTEASDLDQWRYAATTEVIKVDGFSVSEIPGLIQGLLGQNEIPGTVMQEIVALTEGRPFYVIELLRDLIERDALIRISGVWQLKSKGIDLDRTVAELLDQRLECLGQTERSVALRLAVSGGELTLSELFSIAGEPKQVILEVCDQLLQRSLVAMRQGRLMLVHDSVCERLYASAEPERVAAFHSDYADYLERELPADHPDRAALIGHH